MIRILFVCTGNICRSPMAEAIMRHKVALAGLEHQIEVDGAGTGSWHEGEEADYRTVAVLARRGIELPSRARQVHSGDFEAFDFIIAMDRGHVLDLERWPGARPEKVSLFLTWLPNPPMLDVPDPYYGGMAGFETMYDLLDSTCDAILATIAPDTSHS